MDVISEMNILQNKGEKVYDMAVGDPNLPVPSRIIGGLEYALKSGIHQYSPAAGYESLRELIYPEHADNVIIGNGAKELISLVFKYNADKKLNGTMIIGPTWGAYTYMAYNAGINNIDLFCPDYSKNIIEQILDKIKANLNLIVICNPNNPTGYVWSKEDLIKLNKICNSFDLYMLIDETYKDYVYEGDFYSAIGLNRAIVIRSLSKTYSITGWRCGYLIGPADAVSEISDIKRNIIGSPNSLIQKAIEYNWGRILDDNRLAVMRERRDALAEIIGNTFTKVGKKMVTPSAGFYFFIPVSDADSAISELRNHNIFATHGRAFGDPHCIRLSFANISIEDIKEIQPILAEIFDKY